ncbi:hypothetical protein PVBG_05217 [Plasmodium vivax Brazil I]|uniref:VIR protein n=1 Tax=Plasmodium vivax (strain Brazil I) TaxID=1033975 RepID=A0A0J9SMM5_PLAV1|nr:hypothetical protein PVBG_05217 [Plasmodium vivax Brazil I]
MENTKFINVHYFLNFLKQDVTYPFLNEIWNLYDSFDKSVEGDSKPLYDSICELGTENLDNDKTKYYDICMNIIRNLDPYCKKGETCMLYSDRCSNVNNWLYNIIEEKDFNKKHIIKRIFDLTKIIRPEINRNGCPYYSYDTEYKEPMNTIHLKFFTDNIDVIERTLKSNAQPNNTLCQRNILKKIIIFYEHIWNSCDFDKPVDYSQDNKQIIELCEKNETYKTNPTENYKNICNQLLNNLKILSNNSYSNTDTFITRCKNLNNWLYFKQNELSVSSDIISQIFQAYKQIKNEKYHTNDCAYSTFDNGFNEKEELINLRIFNDNGETIQALLKNNNISNVCSLKKYVYKCIEVYRAMYKSYSFHPDCNSHQYKNACNIINEFKQLYSSFIYKNRDIHHDFPELSSNTITNVIDECSSQENTTDSTSGELPQTGTSMKGAVSPALGFTPVRKFLSFRNNKNARAFSNLGEEVENELIIQQFEDTRINSVHSKYNVAYGQI